MVVNGGQVQAKAITEDLQINWTCEANIHHFIINDYYYYHIQREEDDNFGYGDQHVYNPILAVSLLQDKQIEFLFYQFHLLLRLMTHTLCLFRGSIEIAGVIWHSGFDVIINIQWLQLVGFSCICISMNFLLVIYLYAQMK